MPVEECASGLGSILSALGRLDEAAPLFSRAVAAGRTVKGPSLVSALFNAAQYELARGDVDRAGQELSELMAADADPGDYRRILLEAEVARAKSGCRAARESIRRAAAAVAKAPLHSDRLAAALLAVGCDLELGEPTHATAALETELKWLEDHHADAEAMAPAQRMLARAHKRH